MFKQNRFGTFILAFILVTSVSFIREVSADTIPGVPWLKQEKFAWCWAASSNVLLKYYIKDFNKTQAEIAKTISNNTSADGDTVPREKVPQCIILSSKPTPTSAPLLNATFLNRPLTFTELKDYAAKKKPFTVMYNFHIRPYYHCVVYGGYINDSTRIKIIDPDQLRGTKTYINSYKELITGAQYGDIWVACILVEEATSVDEMVNFVKNSPQVGTFIRKNINNTFSIVCNNPDQNIHSLHVFNSRGVSVFSSIIGPNKTNDFALSLAPGMYTIQTKSISRESGNTVKNKPVAIVY